MRSAAAFLFVIACASGAKDGVIEPIDTGAPIDPLAWAVDKPGPYAAGYRAESVTYAPGEGLEARTLRLNVWYPTTDEDGSTATYTVGTDSQARQGASIAPAAHSAGYPVHVHSHGYRGFGATSAFLARYLASHGWVTVAPDHAQNTLVDHVDPLPFAHFIHRPLDVSAALDALPGVIPEVDVSRVVLSGHSFGSYTAWASAGATVDMDSVAAMCATGEGIEDDGCSAAEQARVEQGLSDPRVVGIVPMAGTLRRSWFGDSGERSVSGPVLFFGGTNDDVGQAEQFAEMGPIDFTWVELQGACHQSFALGSCDTLDRDQGFFVVQSLALAFGRAIVLDDRAPRTHALLSGEEQISEFVTTKVR